MKKIIAVIIGAVVLILIVLIARTAMFTSSQEEVEPVTLMEVDAEAAARHLGEALTFRTISHQNPEDFDAGPYVDFRRFLASTYPRMHSTLSLEVVNNYSLLYTWEGSNPGLPPIIMLAHMDVVPVDPITIDEWTHPPYGGVVADGYVWGRGAIDNKGGLMGIVEAVEHLLAIGFQPERTVYFAFGHDEEIGGDNGAAAMASMLQERGVTPRYLLDEGGHIDGTLVSGIDAPVALVGVAEKGYFSVELAVRTDGGHSSRPPNHTGLGTLSQAVVNLENNQFKASLESPVKERLATLGPYQPYLRKMMLANLWLFSGAVKAQMLKIPVDAASIRTSIAVTMATGSSKENILPVMSTMIVNLRLLPGSTIEEVLAHLERAIDDPQVIITPLGTGSEASPVSDIRGEIYGALSRVIREVFPGTVVTPNMLLGATDSSHFIKLTAEVFRFYPTIYGPGDAQRVHGTDERTSVANFAQIVQFFARLLEVSTAE